MNRILRRSRLLPLGLVLAALLLPLSASAQDLPTARQVLDDFVEAVGGREALTRHESVHTVGKFSVPGQGIEGGLEVWSAVPDRMLLRVEIPGLGEIRSGYDGTTGWTINPMTGPQLVEGKELEQLRAQADFYRNLYPAEDYTSMKVLEKADFGGRPAYKMELVRTTGVTTTEYFDVETKLLLGMEMEQETPMGPVPVTLRMEDYEDFEGFRIATRTVMEMMGMEQIMTVESVEYDNLEPDTFAPPESIQALLEEAPAEGD